MPKPGSKDPLDEIENKLEGFPEDGEEFPMGDDPGDTNPEPDKKPEDPLSHLTKQVEALQRDNEALKRQIPPATPKTPDPKDAPAETDWNNLLFTDPKAAVAEIKRQAKEEVTREMRGEYNKAENTKVFWRKFYAKNKDLRSDHDLVELTLNGNLGDLANIPVDTAMERLADLTRQRILRYTGSAASNRGKKARVEGSDAPTPPREAGEPDEPVRLSDIIKARRNKRASAA